MITEFRIGTSVATHIGKLDDLMERVVFLVNEYTCDYVSELKFPIVNEKKYNKDILELVELLLDKRLPKVVRPLIKARVIQDKDLGTTLLEINWDASKPDFVAPLAYSKRSIH